MRTIFDAGFLPRLLDGLLSVSSGSFTTTLGILGFGGEPIVPVFGLKCKNFLGLIRLVSDAGAAGMVLETQPFGLGEGCSTRGTSVSGMLVGGSLL
jgi:hypothetical protein